MKRSGRHSRGNMQTALLLVIAGLAVVWWMTLPPESPEVPPTLEASGNTWAPGDDSQPSWSSNIDTDRPECAKLRDEIAEQIANGAGQDLLYIGDCDKRLGSPRQQN